MTSKCNRPPPSGEQLFEQPVNAWATVVLKARVDSMNHAELAAELEGLVKAGRRAIAVDLRHNRFLCVQAIQAIEKAAVKVAAEGGQLALVACSERIKRHFEVYGSLEKILVVRTEKELVAVTVTTIATKASARVAS